MMRMTVSPSRDHLRRMKKAHQYRALLKQTATASGRSSSSAHGRSSAAGFVLTDATANWCNFTGDRREGAR